MAAKSAKKPARRARKRSEKPNPLAEKVAELERIISIQKNDNESLRASVEGQQVVAERLIEAFNTTCSHNMQMAQEAYEAREELAIVRERKANLEGKIEGMMEAYQHAFETVTDNLANNMVQNMAEGEYVPRQPNGD